MYVFADDENTYILRLFMTSVYDNQFLFHHYLIYLTNLDIRLY